MVKLIQMMKFHEAISHFCTKYSGGVFYSPGAKSPAQMAGAVVIFDPLLRHEQFFSNGRANLMHELG